MELWVHDVVQGELRQGLDRHSEIQREQAKPPILGALLVLVTIESSGTFRGTDEIREGIITPCLIAFDVSFACSTVESGIPLGRLVIPKATLLQENSLLFLHMRVMHVVLA